MSEWIDRLESAGFGDRVISAKQLARTVGGSNSRRYGLVNRALKRGTLQKVKRGLYTLGGRYERPIDPYVVAQALDPGSYVSFETALSYHGWIPEAVWVTASVTPGRKSLAHETVRFGRFSFHPLATKKCGFLIGVTHKRIGNGSALVAQPLRALMDLVAERKVEWQGLGWIVEGLRIDEDHLRERSSDAFDALQRVYKHKRVQDFLQSLSEAVQS